MLLKVKHIGYVCRSIDDTMAEWSAKFGAKEVRPRKTFAEIGQTSTLVEIGETRFELMEPYGDQPSTVSKFLERSGEGFHHLSWICDDVNKTAEELDAAGVKVLGAGNPVIFTHPKTCSGFVFEITEEED